MLNGPLINIGRRSTARCHNRFQQTHSFKPEYANIPFVQETLGHYQSRIMCDYSRLCITAIRFKSNYCASILRWAYPTPCVYKIVFIDEIVHTDYALFFFCKVICEYATFCIHFMLLFIAYFYQFMDVRYIYLPGFFDIIVCDSQDLSINHLHNSNKAYK